MLTDALRSDVTEIVQEHGNGTYVLSNDNIGPPENYCSTGTNLLVSQ